ncbi:VP2 [Polyomavirus sp.]|uniref:VP2 n=1 Tax=Polyomavirus sp. TaxID=36362 RepID=UPI0008DBE681|nr:VP2 [Polyomavirus sp.]AOW44157.1 VP2 [Polyomavirus sp.]
MFLLLGMGALLAVFAEVIDLAAATGLGIDAILSAEAITTSEALEALITNLVTLEGFSEAEALTAAGLTAQASAAFAELGSLYPQILYALAFDSLTVGTAVAAALAPNSFDHPTPIANLNMALVRWVPDFDFLFPGFRHLARFINYIDPTNWAPDLYETLGRYVWEGLQRRGERFIDEQIGNIEHVGREAAIRTVETFTEALARYFENARWAVSYIPHHIYSGLEKYYTQLPPLNPIQIRDVSRRTGLPIPDRTVGPNGENVKSAQYVEKPESPGGAMQRSTPDWMLPLILGLYGDVSPSWGETLQDLENQDGPLKKRKKTH